MGFVFGISAAIFFAGASVLVRIGQRYRTGDDGVLMTVFMNVLALGAMALLFASMPPFDTAGIVALIIGGVIGTVMGRSTNLRAVRLIGPSRASAFITGTPVAAAVMGWIVLGEALTPVEVLGGALVVGGLLWLVSVRAGARGVTAGAVPRRHYLIAAAAPMFFGTAFVIRKWGLQRFDSSIIGPLLGAAAAFAVLVLVDVARGTLKDRIAMNVTAVPWWFVGAGVATSLALFSQFTAFGYLPAWVVGILQATQGIWAILLSVVFLKGDERVDGALIGSVVLVVSGVVLIAVQ